jgi:hypothetical protein
MYPDYWKCYCPLHVERVEETSTYRLNDGVRFTQVEVV